MDIDVVLNKEEVISAVINTLYNYFAENGSLIPEYSIKGVSCTQMSENGLTINFSFKKEEMNELQH